MQDGNGNGDGDQEQQATTHGFLNQDVKYPRVARLWREQECPNDQEQHKAPNGQREAKDHPLGLLALASRGDAPIAIDLQANQAEYLCCKQQGIQYRTLTDKLIDEKDIPRFIEDDEWYSPAGPARHKPTTGEEQEEDREAHLSQEFKHSDQPKPDGSHRPQTNIQKTGIGSATCQHEAVRTKKRHAVLRTLPEDQRGQHRVDQKRPYVQPHLISRQEARREAQLVQQVQISLGQLNAETRRARLADRLEQGVGPRNGDGAQQQDQQRQRNPAHAGEHQPASMQAGIGLVKRLRTRGCAWLYMLQIHLGTPFTCVPLMLVAHRQLSLFYSTRYVVLLEVGRGYP